MKSYVIAAALFAGVTVAQSASDLQALNSLPPCGVRNPLLTALNLPWRVADISVANMHQEHAGKGSQPRLPQRRG